MYRAEVDLAGLQLEERDALLGELVVAGQSAFGDLVLGDGVIKSDLGDRCKHCRSADTVAGRVEERSYCADSLWCLGRGGGCACVVLYTAANRDVGELETRAYRWEARCFCVVLDRGELGGEACELT